MIDNTRIVTLLAEVKRRQFEVAYCSSIRGTVLQPLVGERLARTRGGGCVAGQVDLGSVY